MKLTHSLAGLALAGALLLPAASARATITIKSSVSFKLAATIQQSVEDETTDGYVSTTEKVTIVSKDILEAFAEWSGEDVPAGASIGMDDDYAFNIVDKDGDEIFSADDLAGFLEYQWDVITNDGRYREKDNGDFNSSFTQRATTEVLLFDTFGEGDPVRSASLNVETDSADLLGLAKFVYTDKLDASKHLYQYKENSVLTVSGAGTIENADATISGDIKLKFTVKDDDARSGPLLGGAAARPVHSPGR